jgi:thiamine-phosphate diphosphorylase
MLTGGRLSARSGPEEIAELLDRIGRAARAGVTLIQIREPGLEARALGRLADASLGVVEGTGTRIVVNDRIDVVLATGIHGVHLKEGSVPAARARMILPVPFLVGRSIHDARQAAAAAEAVDYLIFGTVFASRSKPAELAVTGLGPLAEAASRAKVPVLAIGGVSLKTLPAIRQAGAAGFAAIGFFNDGDPAGIADRVARARQAFDTPPSSYLT